MLPDISSAAYPVWPLVGCQPWTGLCEYYKVAGTSLQHCNKQTFNDYEPTTILIPVSSI